MTGSGDDHDGMTAYWIDTFAAIHDDARLARRVALAGPAMRAAGSVFLARGTPVAVLEGGPGLRARGRRRA